MADLKKLGRYQILKVLGKGGMGIVYKGHDPEIDRTVAIKTVHFDPSLSEENRETLKKRFFQEVRAVGKLLHQNIATIFDVGSYEGVNFFTMEYVEGATFQELMSSKTPPTTQNVVNYIIQAADALHYAHQQGVIHRDIKPANIMVLNDGRVKLMDFGIAKVTQEASSTEMATQAGFIMGTPNYMSPEQVTGKKVDARSDIFSLAIILYEFVTGKKPFYDENVSTTLFKVVNEDPVEPVKVKGNLPPAINEIVLKALKKKTEERYQNGEEFALALRNYQNRTTETVDPFIKEYGQSEHALIQLLSNNCYALENFTDEEFTEIFKICQKHHFQAGKIIFKENTIRSGLYIVISGKVEIYQEIAGNKVVLNSVENGQCFGEMTVLKQFPSTTYAVAITNSFLISVDEKSLKRSGTGTYFKVFKNIAVGMLNRIIKCDQKTGEFLKKSLDAGT